MRQQADQSNYLVRMIVISSKVVSTLAGMRSPGLTDGTGASAAFVLPSAIAVNSDGTLAVVVRQLYGRLTWLVVKTPA